MATSYRLAQPVIDNKRAFRDLFAAAAYVGDIGDRRHLAKVGDHTPWAADKIFGKSHTRGVVYAQDLGHQPADADLAIEFDLRDFVPWLLARVEDGHHPEVKYVICRVPGGGKFRGAAVSGIYDRRHNWRRGASSGHTTHAHLSYMPGSDDTHSTIIRDYAASRTVGAAPATPPNLKRFPKHPPLPDWSTAPYSGAPLRKMPYSAWPPMAGGYGGVDVPGGAGAQQRRMVRVVHDIARTYYRTNMIPAGEYDRQEVGPGTIAWARLVVTKAGMTWTLDAATNGRLLGYALGAPTTWLR